jgi:spoIIIJ-associated protein
MAGVEASGRNVDEAVDNALAELGVSRDEVRIEVLSEGRAGVFGVGGAEARVRVRLLGEDEDQAESAEHDGAVGADGGYIEDEAEIAAQTLDDMLAMMGIQADVSIRDAETPGDGLGMVKAVLDIEGDDLGILIGRRGETLASLQYLLNLMMMRRFGERVSFTVDVEGYRRRRERNLNSMARRLADQVKRSGRPATMEPMPPNERRIIHLALAEDRYVSTASVGEGDERKVTISPKGRRL